MRPEYIETLTSIKTCIAKGYLSYVPGTAEFIADQGTGYRVSTLQSTYIVVKLVK